MPGIGGTKADLVICTLVSVIRAKGDGGDVWNADRIIYPRF